MTISRLIGSVCLIFCCVLSDAALTMHGTENERKETSSFSTHKKSRAIRACKYCRGHKKKCDGQQPCWNCTIARVTCEYLQPQKRGRKRNKNKYEEQTIDLVNKSTYEPSYTNVNQKLRKNVWDSPPTDAESDKTPNYDSLLTFSQNPQEADTQEVDEDDQKPQETAEIAPSERTRPFHSEYDQGVVKEPKYPYSEQAKPSEKLDPREELCERNYKTRKVKNDIGDDSPSYFFLDQVYYAGCQKNQDQH